MSVCEVRIKALIVLVLTYKLTMCEMPVEPRGMCVITIETRIKQYDKPFPGMWFEFVVDGKKKNLRDQTDGQGKYTIIMKEPLFDGKEFWVVFYVGGKIESTKDREIMVIDYPMEKTVVYEY